MYPILNKIFCLAYDSFLHPLSSLQYRQRSAVCSNPSLNCGLGAWVIIRDQRRKLQLKRLGEEVRQNQDLWNLVGKIMSFIAHLLLFSSSCIFSEITTNLNFRIFSQKCDVFIYHSEESLRILFITSYLTAQMYAIIKIPGKRVLTRGIQGNL